MSEYTLESVYGGAQYGAVAYKEETGELFIAVHRVVKKMKIRSGSAEVLEMCIEDSITSMSVENDMVLALDIAGRIYVYSLAHRTEIGRMLTKGCKAAVLKDRKVYIEHHGYIQEWEIDSTGFMPFRKTKHITGHTDTVKIMERTEDGIVTGSTDNTVRVYRTGSNKTKQVAYNRSVAVAAKKIDKEIVIVWSNGEITKAVETAEGWKVCARKYTMANIISADISKFGDMVVCIDTSHNVMLFDTQKEDSTAQYKMQIAKGIVRTKFVEEDEWIVLSGKGSVIWGWRTNTLLADEQEIAQQMCGAEVDGRIVTGTKTGDVVVWDKQLSVLTTKIQAHTSPVIAILRAERGFISVSAGGVCKLHKQTGEVVKEITTDINITAADADEDVLAVGGIGTLELYDIKRSKRIMSTETEMPLRIKVVGAAVFVACQNSLCVISGDSVVTKDMAESNVLVHITGQSTESVVICCLSESGVVSTYNGALEEIEEYRALPKYTNGLGQTKACDIHYTKDETVITYEVMRPDRQIGERKSLYASVYEHGQEIDRWIVLEKMHSDTGKIVMCTSVHGVSIGVCTNACLLVYTDRKRGIKTRALWSTETPEQIESAIEEGDVLAGMIGAVKLQSTPLLHKAVCSGDAVLLGRYFPAELSTELLSILTEIVAEGTVEAPMTIMQEMLQRVTAPPLLRKQIKMVLSTMYKTTVCTTSYADALLRRIKTEEYKIAKDTE